MSATTNAFMEHHNLRMSSERWGDTHKRVIAEIERLNPLLIELLPTLKERLRVACGDELKIWLKRGQSKSVVLCVEDTSRTWILSELKDYVAEKYYLDMKGYDGFSINVHTLGIEQQINTILDEIDALLLGRLNGNNGLKSIIDGLTANQYSGDDKNDAVFFVWAAMVEDGISENAASLWILEQESDRHYYMFEMDDGASLNKAWRLCEDVLPPEVIPVLDMPYI